MTAFGPALPFFGALRGPDAFADAFSISRETLERLKTYAELLAQWQRTMNLVAPKTLPDVWLRHMADSAQVEPLAPAGGHWVDFGAGAGFPGLVVAILRAGRIESGVSEGPAGRAWVTLVESDARKCAFLAEVVRRTGLKPLLTVEILNQRIEAASTRAKLGPVDVVSARAVAALTELLAWSAPLFGPDTVGLFLKGRMAETEIAAAEARWTFDVRLHPSRTEAGGYIVELKAPKARTGHEREGGA